MRNEQGFTLLEGLLSLSAILLLCVLLFPLMMNMLSHLSEEKKELIAYRVLYEYVEQSTSLGELAVKKRIIRDVHYELMMEEMDGGHWKACVTYEEQTKCVD